MVEKEADISQAFKRAAQLYDAPAHHAWARGAKDGIKRLVEVLWESHPSGGRYRRCIIPFNNAEASALRNRHPTYYVDRQAKPPVGKVSIPASRHDAWIREDRLEYV